MSQPTSDSDDDGDTSGVEDATQQYCSFAVTGPQESFQAIYICRSCCDAKGGGQQLFCVCEACAYACHDDHDGLEYVGTGPSYCDCQKLGTGCKLKDCSHEKAADLGIRLGGMVEAAKSTANVLPLGTADDGYIRGAFTMQSLLDEKALYRRLQDQCKELIKHSRETFWLDATMDTSSFCDLELLAWAVFQQHATHYDLDSVADSIRGAEWWVQVKPVSFPRDGQSRLDGYTNGSEAVDMHYDKDEVLAESFGLGSFPTLSTVTYLTDSMNAPPTVVFPRRYDESNDDCMSNMLVSQPRQGKHLVFDGRLLHGAPSHYALRPLETLATAHYNIDDHVTDEQWRITFLVNLWIGHKPVGVNVLPSMIRDSLKVQTERSLDNVRLLEENIVFEPRPVANVSIDSESDLPESLRGRIELPFLGKGTTWENEDDDDEASNGGGMVVLTYPPPGHQDQEDDTIFVQFGPGLEASLRELGEDEDLESRSSLAASTAR